MVCHPTLEVFRAAQTTHSAPKKENRQRPQPPNAPSCPFPRVPSALRPPNAPTEWPIIFEGSRHCSDSPEALKA